VPVRDVLRYPHPGLKAVAPPPEPGDGARLAALAADLVDTMRAAPHCVGLAATQLGELARLVVVDVSLHPKQPPSHGLLVLADPRVVAADGAEVGREGCMSIPDLTANVRRATEVVVEARGLGGEAFRVEAEGFEARCLQHEIDHLDGILFLDRVDSLRDDVFVRRRRGSGR